MVNALFIISYFWIYVSFEAYMSGIRLRSTVFFSPRSACFSPNVSVQRVAVEFQSDWIWLTGSHLIQFHYTVWKPTRPALNFQIYFSLFFFFVSPFAFRVFFCSLLSTLIIITIIRTAITDCSSPPLFHTTLKPYSISMAVSKSSGLRAMQQQVQGWTKYLLFQYWGAFLQPLLQGKSNIYYLFWVCVCSLGYPACIAHASYYIVTCGMSGCTMFLHIIS